MCATIPEQRGAVMRRPRMSTGAWIFTGLICAAVIAPTTVYAATIARFALVSPSGKYSAGITAERQLLTVAAGAAQIVRISGGSNTGNCKAIYTPPAGK